MIKIYNKVQKLTAAVREIQRTDFRFRTENTKSLHNSLDRLDQKCFNFRIEDVIIKDYFRNCAYGLKFYVLQEEHSDLPRARKHFRRLRMLYLAVWAIPIFFVIISLIWMTSSSDIGNG
ncbi:unnamed protein product [Allacma fusca]|uniref:Fatty acyl-CoA reductase C-terminal domain-containing protein n=1 Tax=Allacma fusca TaxID=39272 RepID=A0A8J2JKX5_9HEXA|nr:unnamed protein product [Allacma fusca]